MAKMNDIQNEEVNLNSGEIEVPIKKSEKKRLFIIVTVVAVIALVIGIGFLTTGSSTENRLQKQLDLGGEYIDELDYEQAAVAFELAISIDEKCAEAYLGAAQAYEALGDTEKAMEFLETGYEKTGDVSLQNELERLQAELASLEEKTQESQNIIDEVDAKERESSEVENQTDLVSPPVKTFEEAIALICQEYNLDMAQEGRNGGVWGEDDNGITGGLFQCELEHRKILLFSLGNYGNTIQLVYSFDLLPGMKTGCSCISSFYYEWISTQTDNTVCIVKVDEESHSILGSVVEDNVQTDLSDDIQREKEVINIINRSPEFRTTIEMSDEGWYSVTSW